jgi:hypothetical protein
MAAQFICETATGCSGARLDLPGGTAYFFGGLEHASAARVQPQISWGSDVRPDKRELKRRQVTDRRSVLLLGAAAVAQVPLINDARAEAKAEPQEADPGQLRYSETDHIRAFYARSRF